MQEDHQRRQTEELLPLAQSRQILMLRLTHEHPQPKTECQFGAAIPSGEVICTSVFREHCPV